MEKETESEFIGIYHCIVSLKLYICRAKHSWTISSSLFVEASPAIVVSSTRSSRLPKVKVVTAASLSTAKNMYHMALHLAEMEEEEAMFIFFRLQV